MSTDLGRQLQIALGDAYSVERELGGGGMSRVFVATETALERRVVVKVLPPELSEAVSAERFRREIQLAAKLQHPHIVPVHTGGEAGELLYYFVFMVASDARDAGEAAVRTARAMRARHRELRAYERSPAMHVRWSAVMAYRGHVREAIAAAPSTGSISRELALLIEYSVLDTVPARVVEQNFARQRAFEDSASDLDVWVGFSEVVMLPWWALRGDTARLRGIAADSGRRTCRTMPADCRPFVTGMARGLLALARADTLAAAREFATLEASFCTGSCKLHYAIAARALATGGRHADAERLLEQLSPMLYLGGVRTPSDVLLELERGRVAERLGERERAVEAYAFVVDSWRNPDPSLGAYVREARAGLERLGADRRRRAPIRPEQ